MKERPNISETSNLASKAEVTEVPKVEECGNTDAIYPPENESMYAHSGDDD